MKLFFLVKLGQHFSERHAFGLADSAVMIYLLCNNICEHSSKWHSQEETVPNLFWVEHLAKVTCGNDCLIAFSNIFFFYV